MNKIFLPPPNVTGSLHLGHALNITIQDIQVRFNKLQGKHMTWVPGTDHAGIATQLVAKRIAGDRVFSSDKEFIDFIWIVKERHETAITDQLKKMNTLLDWNEYTFTLQPSHAAKVEDAFSTLFRQGLIFRDKRLTYWDTKLGTACSDLEVDFKQAKGEFFYLKYKLQLSEEERDLLASDSAIQEYVVVATTRPETIFADCALAVNPNDPNTRHLIGKTALVPIVNRPIPIIGDELVEIGKGTGILKITPAHDLLDAEIGKKHTLKGYINVIDKNGCLVNVPEQFKGLTSQAAKQLIKDYDFVEKVEEIEHSIPIGEKSLSQLELLETDQWFVDMQEMARKAIEVVDRGQVALLPSGFVHIYKQWLENIQPWCISRQIKWGHRIPIYYDDDGNPILQADLFAGAGINRSIDVATYDAGNIVVDGKTYRPESDVLDTWFSSALWAEDSEFLVTGKDILFFWVARMIMLTLHLTGKVPFNTVFLHGLVLDEQGKKMSKVVGNVIDPLDIIRDWGVDVLRLALISKAYPGRNVKFSKQSLELFRNFITKIKNAQTYAKKREADLENYSGQLKYHQDQEGLDGEECTLERVWCQWILQQTNSVYREVVDLIQNWELAKALELIEKFAREELCSWFLEAGKFCSESAIAYLRYGLNAVEHLLHPYAPEFAQPVDFNLIECNASVEPVVRLQAIVNSARSLGKLGAEEFKVAEHAEFLSKFTRLKFSSLQQSNSSQPADDFYKYGDIYVKLQGENVLAKLTKEIQQHQKLFMQAEERLGDSSFLQRAEQETVDEMRRRAKEEKALYESKSQLLSQIL